jgi:hypothetical protein
MPSCQKSERLEMPLFLLVRDGVFRWHAIS